MSTRSAIAMALAATLAIGCGGGEGGSGSIKGAGSLPRDQVAAAPLESGAPPPAYIGVVNTGLKQIVEAALADAARRTGRDASTLQVVSAEAVTWPDGSLGCPEPGMNYTMALVPGYRVRIRAGAEVLDYHASRPGYLVLCPPGRSVDPVPDGSA